MIINKEIEFSMLVNKDCFVEAQKFLFSHNINWWKYGDQIITFEKYQYRSFYYNKLNKNLFYIHNDNIMNTSGFYVTENKKYELVINFIRYCKLKKLL